MVSKPPTSGIDDSKLKVSGPSKFAAGVPGVVHAIKASLGQMSLVRTVTSLSKVNQPEGFDCPGCAWPDPQHRSMAEFCENGAKAVAEEATQRVCGPDFFAQHTLDDLAGRDDYWLGQQGRLTHPMILDDGADRYRPATWDEALNLIVSEITAMDSADQAAFYTSGRTSNEAAFLYQLMVRGLGTNNLPDCSNMCHESSGRALSETIGIGKGSVTLEDFNHADVIIVAGQNPGTNHPRMLTALQHAKANGSTIIAVNPLPEVGLMEFANPQSVSTLLGKTTPLADEFLHIKLGGDQALFQAWAARLIRQGAIDHDFITTYTTGFDQLAESLVSLDDDEVTQATGLDLHDIDRTAQIVANSSSTIVCWAMGLTQHKHSVAMLQDVVNVLLLGGHIGRPGAGVCPVRGHSNVQGDRTMGIWERPPETFLDALDQRFAFTSPREHGMDTVDALEAMADGTLRVFFGLGGNFVRATPDSSVTEKAMSSVSLTVQVSTKLNMSHVVTGRRAVILPALGRTDIDTQSTGPQRVSVEDSMSMVHASAGHVPPPSDQCRSEPWIVAQLADRFFTQRLTPWGDASPDINWVECADDYRKIRAHIEATIPGFENYEHRLNNPVGFTLPHPPRDRRMFDTPTGKAHFTSNPLEYPTVDDDELLLQTVRSHDQFNTTIYGADDRYRGITSGRRVVFINEKDLASHELRDGDMVDLIGRSPDGVDRIAPAFRVVKYLTAPGCIAAYFPETNVLLPMSSVADKSRTPTSKSIPVKVRPHRPV